MALGNPSGIKQRFTPGDGVETPNGVGIVIDVRKDPTYGFIYLVDAGGRDDWCQDQHVRQARNPAQLHNIAQSMMRTMQAGGMFSVADLQDDEPIKKKPKEVKLDLTALDKLIIAQAVKDEIGAVLQQHSNAKKIFEDWGLSETIEYGKGMTFLFYGKPGTGKTWGAHCISKSIGAELLTIGSGEIQSSEPGAANRNIVEAFKSASDGGKVLFIDECDSLVSSREGVGMVLGSEINTLLTEIEKFEGVLVLATNRVEHLDEALERRIGLIVEFPEPEYEQRIEIWKTLVPKKMPLASDVKFEELARYNMTGGLIKNCVLQAARFAAAAKDNKNVKLEHFTAAIDRVLKSKSLLGTASRWHTAKIREDMTIQKVRQTDKTKGSI